MSEKQPKPLDIAKRLEFHSATAEGQSSLTYSSIDAAKELRRLHEVNVELVQMLRNILESGDWYASALEFNFSVDGEELERQALRALAKATKGQE